MLLDFCFKLANKNSTYFTSTTLCTGKGEQCGMTEFLLFKGTLKVVSVIWTSSCGSVCPQKEESEKQNVPQEKGYSNLWLLLLLLKRS